MKTQISRSTFDQDKRYSAVYQQMGRMFADADWNELSDITKHRLADVLTDVIGSGTPRERGMVEVTDNPDGSKTYALKWGYVYVDGIIAQSRPNPAATLSDPAGENFEYIHQADFPQAPTLPAGNHTLYVDVWERTVLPLEDGSLRDPGLHGADTCTRTQTMVQVKWCPTTVLPTDGVLNPAIGDALLTLTLREGSTEPDPCDPCADEISLQDKVGNYLFRVEVHDVEYDAGGLPQRIVLKWSSENGAEQYAIGSEPADFPSANFAYEFFNGEPNEFASEKHLGKHLAPGFLPARGELTNGYPDSLPTGYSLVRRWDGFVALDNNAGIWTLDAGSDRGVDLSDTSSSTAHGHFGEGATVAINLDSITLSLDIDDHAALAGDFWQATVRQAINVAGDTLLADAAPAGILHHYMTLGSMIDGNFVGFESDDCRRFDFPPLTDIRAKDVCYNNDVCDMPDVRTVQNAIDYLCRERDLRWHNKHLHGWGIVCGLIAQCGPDTTPTPGDDGDTTGRRQVRITDGYALDCEGNDVVLQGDQIIDVISRIEELEQSGTIVLGDGNGSVCLSIGLGDNGSPEIGMEPYDPARHQESPLDGTLLMDFVEHCIMDLIRAISAEFDFLDSDDIDADEGGATGLVSDKRRTFISFINLIIQLLNSGNGSYVYLSRKEHNILESLYLKLRVLLQSKTFCAMFQGEDFPDYPFDDTGMTTYFGKNNHTRAKLHPGGKTVYTYGGTDNTINVYQIEKQELVAVLEMPSAEGAEVSAIAFSPDGDLLYAAASVRAIDSVFGIARINNDHVWEEMTILCDIEIIEMQVSARDAGLIYATGLGKGLFYLRPELFMDDTKPQPIPTYQFNAIGHMAIDEQINRAYCTSNQDSDESEEYDSIAICELEIPADSGDNLAPTSTLQLLNPNGVRRQGTDGLALRPIGPNGRDGRLYVTVDDDSGDSKSVYTYSRGAGDADSTLANELAIENTQVGLAFHPTADVLLLALEDGYRLQVVDADGKSTQTMRVPVQIQPVDVIVNRDDGQIYTLNFISNTISVVPVAELAVDDAFLEQLVSYRTEVLQAFYRLFAGLLQYLKDCFCDHLLVKCPSCDADDILYLATVEIRDNEVYKICNFDKRKYVKSFPTMGYWFSLIPIWPLLKSVVGKFCCAVLPDLFDDFEDDVVTRPPVGAAQQSIADNRMMAKPARSGLQTYGRTDLGAIWRDQTKGFKFGGRVVADSAKSVVETGRRKKVGVKKQALMDSSVNEAVKELDKNRITVTSIQKYDESKANSYIASYAGTPRRIEPGSKVTLIQHNGKVRFYSVEKETTGATFDIPDDARRELDALEQRKTELVNMADLEADFARVEARRARLVELDSVKAELTQLQAAKTSAEDDLTVLRSQVESVRTQRETMARELAELNATGEELATGLAKMKTSITDMDLMRKKLRVEVDINRPVADLAGVGPDIAKQLNTLGIRNIEDLSKANVRKLSAADGIDERTARSLIKEARTRLEP